MKPETDAITAGGALLARLKALGVDYLFANSGTDFPPIVEGLAEAVSKNIDLPAAMVMPHEHAAMGMAHGYYLATGRAQAVMLHTNVGLANGAIGAINAATDHVPMLIFSGRTPATEKGRFGTRTVPIGWGQEMRDQAALVREATKWDYELRFPEQIPELVDRAHSIASSTPRGPVYLSLPREVLCQPCPMDALSAPPAMAVPHLRPSAADIERAAAILTRAERPMIVAQRGAGSAQGFATLAQLTEDWAIPVLHYWAVQLALSTEHPMYAGSRLEPWIGEADAILVIDSLAPWSPDVHRLRPGCRVIHLGPDPLYSRFPVRNFPSHVSIAAETADALAPLAQAMGQPQGKQAAAVAARRAAITTRTAQIRSATRESAEAGNGAPMSKAWVSLCLAKVLAGQRATVLSELGCPLDPLTLQAHGSWYQEPHSGGLGWSLPCGLGVQLADPERLVVATMGDGSYLFANPVACHQIAEAYALPVLTIVLNNAEWAAVRHSVAGLYPHGYASRMDDMPLVGLSPSPDFVKVAEASRAYAERVTTGSELPGALMRAIRVIKEQRRQALLDVSVAD